jgi:hypothetical protein
MVVTRFDERKREVIRDCQDTIIFFSPIATYPVAFAAKAVSLGNYRVIVVVPRSTTYQNGDHETCYSEMLKDKNITVREPSDSPPSDVFGIFALFSASFYYTPSDYQSLLRWSKRAKRVGGLCHKWPTQTLASLKSTIKYLKDYPGYSRRLSVIGFEELPRLNLFSLYARSVLTGIYAHPRYFHDEPIANALNEPWDPRKIRAYKINFLGTRAPEERVRLLKMAETWFANRPHLKIINNIETYESDDETKVFWRALNPEHNNPRPSTEYLQILTSSDFTLCVPGYTVWSCRPPEAFLRGSIPIMMQEEVDNFYDCKLLDMVNCIIVRNDNWIEALEKAFSLSLNQLIMMRCNIWKLRCQHFELSAWATRLREKLGV